MKAVVMFICELCGAQVPPGIPCARVVVETRPKVYPARKVKVLRRGKPVERDIPETRGTEIVREARACPACAEPG